MTINNHEHQYYFFSVGGRVSRSARTTDRSAETRIARISGDNYRLYATDTRLLTTTVTTEIHITVDRQYLYNHGSVL